MACLFFLSSTHVHLNIAVNMSLSLHGPSSPTDSSERVEPNLMPFHVEYDGAAPISTYFLVKTNEPPPSDASSAPTRRVYSAAFRGRTIHGVDVQVPEGYSGVTLHVDPSSTATAPAASTAATTSKRKRANASKAPEPHKFAKSLTGRRGPTRSKALAEVAEEDDDNSQNTLVGDAGGENDTYAFMSEEIVNEEPISDMSTQALEDSPSLRQLMSTGSFESMIVWAPDVPPDNTRDEFIRAIDDWTRLADVVSFGIYHISGG